MTIFSDHSTNLQNKSLKSNVVLLENLNETGKQNFELKRKIKAERNCNSELKKEIEILRNEVKRMKNDLVKSENDNKKLQNLLDKFQQIEASLGNSIIQKQSLKMDGKSYMNEVYECLSDLILLGVSGNRSGEIIELVLSKLGFISSLDGTPSVQTAYRALFTKKTVSYYKFIKLVGNLSDIWIMPDGTTSQRQHFDSFLIGGWINDELIVYPLKLLRTKSGGGGFYYASLILEELKNIIKKQRETISACESYKNMKALGWGKKKETFFEMRKFFNGMKVLDLHSICSFIYDNCSVNTGENNGIGSVFQRILNEHLGHPDPSHPYS